MTRIYDTARWRKLRASHLARHPLCVMCERAGRVRAATVLDHKVTVRSRPDLAWEPSNHQALCATCHSSLKQAQDRTGRIRGCDVDGRPLDPGHYWNRNP